MENDHRKLFANCILGIFLHTNKSYIKIYICKIYLLDIYSDYKRRKLMARSNKTKYAILGLLAFKNMSGYDIKNMMAKSTNHFWTESLGQIYPTLAKLLKDNCILEIKTATKSKRERNIYKLTKKGLKILQEWLPKPPQPTTARDELILKIFFGKNISAKQLINLINKRRINNLEHIEQLQLIKNHLITKHDDPDSFYWIFTVNLGIHHANADIAWCDETIKMLKKPMINFYE